jgi:hypothetical protein
MAGIKGNKAHANETSFTCEQRKNVPAYEIWDEVTSKKTFEKILVNAENDDNILCLHDAIRSVGLWTSSFYYILTKFPKLEDFKKDIQQTIISRINKKALNNSFNSTASIWRMKMLGECEVIKTENKNRNTDIDIIVDGEKFE